MATKKKKNAKKKSSASKTNEYLLAQMKALDKITEHNRDFLSLTLTIPLGNPALKKVHTNQWLFTDLPREFDLANWTILAEALNSTTNRNKGYVKNRWYIEGNNITVDVNGKAEMKLNLNAFASSLSSYTDMNREMQKAYSDAKNQQNQNKKNKNKTKAVTNSKVNTSLKGGWGVWALNWVKDVVGMVTDPLKKAKLIDKKFKSETHWSDYEDAQKTRSSISSYEKAYKSHYMNCADGANLLSAFFNSANIEANIMHTSGCTNGRCWGHYIIRLSINGKYYWTDCSAGNGQLCNKPFNQVFGYKGGTNKGKRLTY